MDQTTTSDAAEHRSTTCAWCGHTTTARHTTVRTDQLLSSFHRATGVHRFVEPTLAQMARKRGSGNRASQHVTERQLAAVALPPGLLNFGIEALRDQAFLSAQASICPDCTVRANAAKQTLGGTQMLNQFRRHPSDLEHRPEPAEPLLLPEPPAGPDPLTQALRAQCDYGSSARFSRVPAHLRSIYFHGQPLPKHSDYYGNTFHMTQAGHGYGGASSQRDGMSGTQLVSLARRGKCAVGAEDANFLKRRQAMYDTSPMMKAVQHMSPLRLQKDQNHITAGFTTGLLQQEYGSAHTVPAAKGNPMSLSSQ